MKKKLLLATLLLGFTRVSALSSRDSIQSQDFRPDSIEVSGYVPDSNFEDAYSYVTVNQPLQGTDQPFELNTGTYVLTKAGFWKKVGGFFKTLYDVILRFNNAPHLSPTLSPQKEKAS